MKPKARGPYAPRKPNLRDSLAPKPRTGNLATLAALRAEVQRLTAENAELHAAIARTWSALGITSYEQAGGKDVAECVAALKADNARLTELLDAAGNVRIDMAGDIVKFGADNALLRMALTRVLEEPYGCPFCDMGVLRKRVDGDTPRHADSCPFALARAALASGSAPTGTPKPAEMK